MDRRDFFIFIFFFTFVEDRGYWFIEDHQDKKINFIID